MIPAALVVLAVVASAAEATGPRVVAKGDGYLVHLVPATPSRFTLTATGRAGRGAVVTHTRTDTGVMTILAEGDGSPAAGKLLISDFYSWDTRAVAEARADDERVYVIVTHSKGHSTPSMGARGTTTAELRVFWLADGSLVGKWPAAGAEPDERGWMTPDARVWMTPDLHGVAVRGEAFRFKGKELVGRLSDTPTTGTGPVLLSSGKGYAIHAVRSLPPTAVGDAGGTTILYVPFAEGHSAHTVLQTGNREEKREKGADEFPPPRVTQTRIVATAIDGERLYVLVWHGEWTLWGPGEFVGPLLGNSDDYRLYTFWLADGIALPPVRVKGGEKATPAESLRGDRLELVANGVKAFGQTVTFKGKERVKE